MTCRAFLLIQRIAALGLLLGVNAGPHRCRRLRVNWGIERATENEQTGYHRDRDVHLCAHPIRDCIAFGEGGQAGLFTGRALYRFGSGGRGGSREPIPCSSHLGYQWNTLPVKLATKKSLFGPAASQWPGL